MDKALVLLPLKSKWKKLMQVFALVIGLYVCLHVSMKTAQTFLYIKSALTPLCDVPDHGSGHQSHLTCPLIFDSTHQNKPIILTFATVGWYDLVENWACSLKKTNVSGIAVVVSLDRILCEKLRNTIEGVICFEPFRHQMYLNTHEPLKSAKSWGSSIYRKIIKFRTQVIYSMLRCYRFVLLSDVDVVFLRDRLPHSQQLGMDTGTSGQFDLIFQRDFMDLTILDYFENWTIRGKWYVCAGQ